MAKAVKRSRRLMDRKYKIEKINDKRRPQNALKSYTPAEPPPRTRLRFRNRLGRNSAPARAHAFAPLVHTDLAVTLFSLLTLWRFAEIWRNPIRKNAVLFGLCLAPALLSKFTRLFYFLPSWFLL
jgi:hypothetical protein